MLLLRRAPRALARVAAVAVTASAISTGWAGVAHAGTPTVLSGAAVLNDGPHTITVSAPGTYVPGNTAVLKLTSPVAGDPVLTATGVSVAANTHTITGTFDYTLVNPGAYDLAVFASQASQSPTDSCSDCVSVNALKPSVTSVSPSSLAQGTSGGGYQGFVITGQSFARGLYSQCTSLPCTGPKVAVYKAGTTTLDTDVVLSQTVNPANGSPAPTSPTATSITLRVSVGGSASAPYADDIVVINSDGKTGTCAGCLTIQPRPTILSAVLQATGDPEIGQNATGQTVVITGDHLPADTAVFFNAPNSTSGAFTYSVPAPPVTVGDHQVLAVTNVSTTGVTTTDPGWSVTVASQALHATSNASPFTVNAPPAPVAVSHLDGDTEQYGQGASNVRLQVDMEDATPFTAGSGSTPHTQVTIVGKPAGVTIASQTAIAGAPNHVDLTLSVAPGTPTGDLALVALNPDGGTSAACDNSGPLPTTPNTCVLSIASGPTITSLAPSTLAGTGSAQQLVVNGTGFRTGAAAVSVVVGPPATPYFSGNVTADSATKITLADVMIPGDETAKDVDVTVTNRDDKGSATTTAIQRLHVANLAVTSVGPTSQTNDGAYPVQINGTHLSPSGTVQLVRAGSILSGTGTVDSSSTPGAGTAVTAAFDLTNVAPGTYDAVVTNPDTDTYPGTASCVACFTVVAPSPTVSAVSPSTIGGGAPDVTVTITGTHFYPGATVAFSNTHVHPVGSPVVTLTSITQHVSVDSGATTSTGTLTVTNTDGQGASKAFSTAAAPTITSMAPTSRAAGTTFSLTVNGTGLTSGTTLAFSVAGISAGNYAVNGGGTQLTADVTSLPTVTTTDPVAVHVSVVRTDFGQATSPTDLTIDPQPSISSLDPARPAAGSSSTLHVIGDHFLSGATVAPHAGVTGLTISNVQRVSATELTATLAVAAGAAAGDRQIDVTNPDGGLVSGLLHVITVPTAPTSADATGGLKQVVASWSAPTSDGDSAVTGYTVTITKHGEAVPVSSATTGAGTTSRTFTNLFDATQYDVAVMATNAAGNSPAASASATTFSVSTAPTSPTATAGVRQVSVGWAAPANNGGTPVTSYKVSITPSGGSATTFTTPDAATTGHTFTGLVNAKTYAVAIVATNAVGDSAAATPASVSTADVPSAPTGLTATGGTRQVGVNWAAPASNGGAAVTSYRATVTNNANPADTSAFTTADATTVAHTFTGLQNGATYAVTVIATNAAGDSVPTSGSASTYGLAGTPATLSVAGGVRQVTATWSAPTSTGGQPVTSYTATLQGPTGSSAVTVPGDTTSHTFTGLANATTYTVSVMATTAVGDGPAKTGTASTFGLPGAPTGVKAVPGDRLATVSWTAPASNGGTPITGYRVTATGGATRTTTSTSLSFTGLTNGADYAFTVTAINAAGEQTSTASTPVMPLGTSRVSFSSLPSKVVYGTAITIGGTVVRSDTTVAPTAVAILAQYDNGKTILLREVAVASNGAYSYRFAPKWNWRYLAIYEGDSHNDEGFSVIRRTLVAVKITASAPSGSASVNQVVSGAVYPNKAGRTISLYKVSSSGALTRLKTVTLSSTSTYRFSVRLPRGRTTLRVIIGNSPNNVGNTRQLVATRT